MAELADARDLKSCDRKVVRVRFSEVALIKIMDPLTAMLNLATEIVKLIGKGMDGQPPEVRAQMWMWYIEDMKAWREFWDKFKPKDNK